MCSSTICDSPDAAILAADAARYAGQRVFATLALTAVTVPCISAVRPTTISLCASIINFTEPMKPDSRVASAKRRGRPCAGTHAFTADKSPQSLSAGTKTAVPATFAGRIEQVDANAGDVYEHYQISPPHPRTTPRVQDRIGPLADMDMSIYRSPPVLALQCQRRSPVIAAVPRVSRRRPPMHSGQVAPIPRLQDALFARRQALRRHIPLCPQGSRWR
ncbi:hypothetical protein DFH09DRAFT_373111 [Mycena vulgaris]|nr:hypothetical protein DFH09DRAFT_373111 [Mycena vulgaris]